MAKDNNSVHLLQEALRAEQEKNKQLEEQKAALVAEFSNADSFDDQLEIAKNAIKDILPDAVHTLKYLIANSDKDAVRGSLSKWVVESVLNGKLDRTSDKTTADLLKALTESVES